MTMSLLPICLIGLVAQIGLSQPAVAQSNAPASQPLLWTGRKRLLWCSAPARRRWRARRRSTSSTNGL